MGLEPTDRRVRRTRELLRSALLSLVEEKGYDRITVQDILDRADIGRSTFYAHYRDKDDLLESGFQDVRAALVAERVASTGEDGRTGEFLQPLLAVFQHVETHRRFWKPLSRKGGADLITRLLRENVADLVREHLRARFPGAAANELQFEVAVQSTIGACMSVLLWWLDNDVDRSAEEIHSIFGLMLRRGLEPYLTSA